MLTRRGIIIAGAMSALSERAFANCGTPANPSPNLGAGADLNGLLPFSAASAWNTPVDTAALSSTSTATINACGPASPLHPDFGTVYNGSPNGIPYIVVPASQPLVAVTFGVYAAESDPGPYPIPPNAPIENYGAPDFATADRHVTIVQANPASPNGLGTLYELFGVDAPAGYPNGTDGWTAKFGCHFDMTQGDLQRPDDITSADAAGLPIFPGLLRYDEILHALSGPGYVRHAIRFVLDSNYTRWAVVPPAQHVAGPNNGIAPFGMRVRLKASWTPPGGFSAINLVIANTLKKFGMIMADNGGVGFGNFFMGGAPDPRWDDGDLSNLRTYIHGSDFEVLDSGTPRPLTP